MSSDLSIIEDYLPIVAISAEASREKSVRRGHISTLHLWWARRPLVACRAAVFGSLVPADWPERNAKLKEQLDSELNGDIEKAKKKYGGKVPNRATSAAFVKHLCKYPGSQRAIQTAQRLILTAHAECLTAEVAESHRSGKIPLWMEEFKFTGDRVTMEDIAEGRAPRPRILDMFAGGGSIPLEALRLGCEAYALDLNPVAHIIELCTLVYPQKYGKPDPNVRGMTGLKNNKGETTWGGLAEEVQYWGEWVLCRVKADINDLYPPIPDPDYKGKSLEIEFEHETGSWIIKRTKESKGSTHKENLFDKADSTLLPPGYLQPVAYLWTRTIRCKNPACGATVPLVRQTWLSKKAGQYVALKIVAPKTQKQVRFEIVRSSRADGFGFDPSSFSKAGNTTCPFCGSVADSDYVKAEGRLGRMSQQMMTVICTRPGERGKVYLSSDEVQKFIPKDDAIQKRVDELCKRKGLTVPDEILVEKLTDQMPNYGMRTFRDLFIPRQMICMLTFVAAVREAEAKIREFLNDERKAKGITAYMAIMVDRLADYNSSGCTWESGGQFIGHTFTRQALQLVWDFAELSPFGDASGSPKGALEWIIGVIESLSSSGLPAEVQRGSAMSLPWTNAFADLIITDPPYYDNIQYASLSDFFYVWLRRTIGQMFPEHFSTEISPKKNEAVASPWRHKTKTESQQAYETMMAQSFSEAYRVLKPSGQMTVVYAHKTTLGWATLVDALRRSGFIVTEAWPLDTERGARLLAMDSSALASSIFLVARKREEDAGIGQYEDNVQPELVRIVRERVDTLWDMGVTGADLVIAAVGAGLRAFTRYKKVEYANGEEVPAEKFLAEVEGVVLDTMMAKLFGITGGNVSAIDPASRFYVLWRFVYKTAEIEAGEAIVFTYSQHVELDGPKGLSVGKDALVEKKKAKYRIRDFAERGQHDKLGLPPDNGQPAPLIDVLHRILWLIENSPRKLAEFLDETRPDRERLRVVAQTLAGAALSGKSEQEAERLVSTTPAEQAALGKLLANWRNLIESQLVAAEEGLFGKKGRQEVPQLKPYPSGKEQS